MSESQEQKLVGVEIVSKSVKLEGENVVGAVAAQHVGKLGFVKITLEGGFQLLPLVGKGIDKLEELIPGDQKVLAQMAKTALMNIKIKF